ncbi:MAG: Asp-tRNA(Asn)/Glu-tRNA(Gln) amidotransferase subunit GatC [Clostridia bacterium]|nr:Asp-tRNA(Asn)/Glu-tRNA(Gln) amidotransferase subunit GatC [Clostridia bacterium]
MNKIEHLEYLSKLKFSDEEREKFEKEFDDVLAFVDEIKALEIPQDLGRDKPIALAKLREDEPKESMSNEDVLQNAPKQKDGCYVTPLVVE